jgi:uncharacterized membrane protein YhfC
MVSPLTIVSMFVFILFSFVLFTGLIVFFKKKEGISVKPIVLGAIGFIVFTQVLEKLLHVIVISNFPDYADHPWLFGLYGSLAAGIFEEMGRFILFVWLLKAYREYKHGIAFGAGWGGIEAIILPLMMALPNIIFSFMINAGTFETSLESQMTANQLVTLKETVVNQGAGFYYYGMVERFLAVFIQLALSILVLLGVTKKRFSLVLLSVFIHAFIDFPFTFFQTKHLSQLWMIELYLLFIAVCAVLFIIKSKQWFRVR